MKKYSVLCCLLLVVSVGLFAQKDSALHFTYQKERINKHEARLMISVQLQPGIQLYSIDKKSEDGLYSSLGFDTSTIKLITAKVEEKGKVKTEKDQTTHQQDVYFTDSVSWVQNLNIEETDSVIVKGTFTYLYRKGDSYQSGEEPFRIYIEALKHQAVIAPLTNAGIEKKSLWWIFLAAFGGGLLALLTPCVYSMIPVTVSFFTKRSKTKAEGKKNAVYYALSIIIIFTLLGFLVTLIFGPAALNNLATNWIANLVFFVLFLLFGFSFLGAFEIALPSSWTTKTDAKAGMSSVAGIFFMALTLVLVSFSCTGPIIGNLLVLAAKGSYWGPLTGMFGFSLALALPFALFAFFPGHLNVLGKAGGWLNAIKVTLGLLELALALKFLSNADLSKGWRLLDREVFISLWIVIFGILGLYLLGKLKFHHDDSLPQNDFGQPYLRVTRLMFAIATLSFTVYMIPGLWGAPLKGISAFVPPMGTQDFRSPEGGGGSGEAEASKQNTVADKPVKYAAQMKMYEPEVVTKYGLSTYFDYAEALAVARKLKKPLMLDFTGINCVNCRKMEGQVWSDAGVMKMLKEDFVIVSLYVDVNNIDLPEGEHYFSKALNKQIETLGDKNADMQVTKFAANSQPYYFFVDGNEKKLTAEGYGYDPDVQQFISHLKKVKETYQLENR